MSELDAKICKLVFGGTYGASSMWEKWDSEPSVRFVCRVNETVLFGDGDWSPTTDPSADYEVLKHVRETWPRSEWLEFSEALGDMWCKRATVEVETSFGVGGRYEPGDYSRAALKALGEDI